MQSDKELVLSKIQDVEAFNFQVRSLVVHRLKRFIALDSAVDNLVIRLAGSLLDAFTG